ncbi:hypothetical protein [Agromyces bauzanensis]
MPIGGRRRTGGVTSILVATAVAGGSGYLATAIVGATRPPTDYAAFGVFWATIYLVIAVLSGIQQEVTRATVPVEPGTPAPRHLAFRFGAATALVTAVALAATAVFWAAPVFGADGARLVPPIVLGAAGYVVVAVISGTLSGLRAWTAVAFMIGVDGVLRLAAILTVLAVGGDVVALAWAIAVPFPLTPLLLWWFFRRAVVGRSSLDVGARALVWNSARTVVASVAVGVLVSGYPLLLKVARPDTPDAELGSVIFAVNLVRAPLVIVVLALQGYLVVAFRSAGARSWRLFGRIAAALAGATVVLAAAAGLVGPPILEAWWPEYVLSGWFLAALVASSGLLGLLCVSGPLVLARAEHGIYTTGWVVAAVTTIVCLVAVPGGLATAMIVSLVAGPVVGVAVHLVGLAVRRRQARAADAAEAETQA